MVAKRRIKRVKRVKRTRKQTKQVHRGRKTFTRHYRRTGGSPETPPYNPYTIGYKPPTPYNPVYNPDGTINIDPPPMPPRSLELAKTELATLTNLLKEKPNDPLYIELIAKVNAEIAEFEKNSS